MKKTIKTLTLGLAAVALMAATSVQATPWSSFWVEGLPAGIDRITVDIAGGGSLATPGVEAEVFSGSWLAPRPGWTSSGTSTASDLGNPATDNIYYWINFTSDIATTFFLNQQFWNGSTLVGEESFFYNGTGASNTDPAYGDLTGSNPEGRAWNNVGFADAPFPTPDGGSSLMLLGSSLAGLAWLRRKFAA